MMAVNTGFTITPTLKKTDKDKTGPETAIARSIKFDNAYKLKQNLKKIN